MPRKKRRSQQKRRNSLRKYSLYYLLAVILLAIIALLLSLTVFFRIETITVSGSTIYSDDAIITASGIERGDNLLRSRTKNAADRILKAFPYIENVNVHRALPDELKITVSETRRKTALRAQDGTYSLLSASARILETGLSVCPDDLIPTDGFSIVSDTDESGVTTEAAAGQWLSDTEAERYDALLILLTAFEDAGITDKISLIDLSDIYDIRLLYDGRIAIYAGGITDIAYKMRLASAAIEKNVTDETVGTLDVSQKPTARLREIDIYTKESWPFAEDLIKEYERKIVRAEPWLETETENTSENDIDYATQQESAVEESIALSPEYQTDETEQENTSPADKEYAADEDEPESYDDEYDVSD